MMKWCKIKKWGIQIIKSDFYSLKAWFLHRKIQRIYKAIEPVPDYHDGLSIWGQQKSIVYAMRNEVENEIEIIIADYNSIKTIKYLGIHQTQCMHNCMLKTRKY